MPEDNERELTESEAPSVYIDGVKVGTAGSISVDGIKIIDFSKYFQQVIEGIEILENQRRELVFQERKSVLNSVDPILAEEFEKFSKLGIYHFETLYQVYMANGSRAKDIIETALREKLSPNGLLVYSDRIQTEEARESWIRFARYEKDKFWKDKANTLPRKYREGWS